MSNHLILLILLTVSATFAEPISEAELQKLLIESPAWEQASFNSLSSKLAKNINKTEDINFYRNALELYKNWKIPPCISRYKNPKGLK